MVLCPKTLFCGSQLDSLSKPRPLITSHHQRQPMALLVSPVCWVQGDGLRALPGSGCAMRALQAVFIGLSKCHTWETGGGKLGRVACAWLHVCVCVQSSGLSVIFRYKEISGVFLCCLRCLSVISIAATASKVVITPFVVVCLTVLLAEPYGQGCFQEMHFSTCFQKSPATTFWVKWGLQIHQSKAYTCRKKSVVKLQYFLEKVAKQELLWVRLVKRKKEKKKSNLSAISNSNATSFIRRLKFFLISWWSSSDMPGPWRCDGAMCFILILGLFRVGT